ncbi:MAG: PIN domain-containing protein [Actinomycetales bacterium]
MRSAIDVVDVLTSSPFVHVINPGPGHWPIFRSLLDTNRPRSHDVTDAWLAAAAQEINATWVSFDRGFARFTGLRWIDPSVEILN